MTKIKEPGLREEPRENTVEQIRFPDKVTITAGELPPDESMGGTNPVPYEGGTIEMIDDGTMKIIGFGLSEISEFAPPKPDENYKNYEIGRDKRRRPPRFPSSSEKLETFQKYPPKVMEDIVNMHFYYGGGNIFPEMIDTVPPQNTELRDKILIFTKGFRNGSETAKLIEERPDLKTEILLAACRDYIVQAGHCMTGSAIPYLLSHPEDVKLIPENYKAHLSGLFFLWFHKNLLFNEDVRKVWNSNTKEILPGKEKEFEIERERIKKEYLDYTSKLGIDPNIEGLNVGLESCGFKI